MFLCMVFLFSHYPFSHWIHPWPDTLKGAEALSFHIPLHIATSFVAICFATCLPSSFWQLPCGPTLCLLNNPYYSMYLLDPVSNLRSYETGQWVRISFSVSAGEIFDCFLLQIYSPFAVRSQLPGLNSVRSFIPPSVNIVHPRILHSACVLAFFLCPYLHSIAFASLLTRIGIQNK